MNLSKITLMLEVYIILILKPWLSYLISKNQLINYISIVLLENSHEYNFTKQLNEECYLRALFTVSKSETIDKLNEIFHETIDNYENTNTNNDISNATDIITNAFRQYKKDRKKVKILSLGKREN